MLSQKPLQMLSQKPLQMLSQKPLQTPSQKPSQKPSKTEAEQPKRIRRSKKQIAESNELFVKAVQANKDLLFGPLSPTVTDALKLQKWEEIRQMLVDKGDPLLATKDTQYIKTDFWQMIRGSTMERFDECKPTTGEAPKDVELSEVSLWSSFVSIYFPDR
jgi:hypothetical protein